ncbi:MAG: aminodeoxychorismate/anthranilate synthase component II, partial [Pseudomonadota bacterium]
VIMGLMHETDNVHGVQFHPESIKTEFGHQMLANFLTAAGLTPRRPNRSAAA